MTPAAGTIRHPDVSEISDLTEGLLSPARTAEVRRHLAECPLCADVHTSLEEIRGLLGTLPGPPRMPVDIAGRIDAALAAEALLDSTTPRPGNESAPDAAPDTDRVVSRETTPAARSGRDARRPAGHPGGTTGPGRRRARRRIAVIAGLTGAAACALGILLAGNLLGGSPDTAARKSPTNATAQAPAAGTYTAQGLQDNVNRLLASGEGAMKASPKAQQQENSTYGLENTSPALGDRAGTDAAAVPSCARNATGRSDTPLAVERGTYQGSEVYLLVLPHPGDPGKVDAYLVGADCAVTPSDGAGHPLLTRTYPRS
ncbi:zf-HC2 domain-containing protein [Streptomyces sp. BR123]|uniref:anti-sigma factor family protein n=1 Tax=Streptomyces sp. BR123 TaxID=2749828 RepID=UPI0015C441F0|nr:anti-sigma factor [Streptomyces sp. BR123]NXY92878.1 zf-HC2 domain-containing protein [Streptomyces sp. BR123]